MTNPESSDVEDTQLAQWRQVKICLWQMYIVSISSFQNMFIYLHIYRSKQKDREKKKQTTRWVSYIHRLSCHCIINGASNLNKQKTHSRVNNLENDPTPNPTNYIIPITKENPEKRKTQWYCIIITASRKKKVWKHQNYCRINNNNKKAANFLLSKFFSVPSNVSF